MVLFTFSVWFILACVIAEAEGSTCTKSATIGANKPQQVADKVDTKSGQLYMARSNSYLVPCCGAITEWQVFIKKPGTIRFQIWRSLGTGEYQLIGENMATYNKGEENNLFQLHVDEQDQISVKEGDYVGWYNTNTGMVGYKNEKTGLGGLILASKKVVEKNATVDWSNVKASDSRSYAIRATVGKGLKPGFKNLNFGISIVNNVEKGTELYQLGFNGVDGMQVPPSFSVVLDAFSEYFDYNQTSNSVFVKASPLSGKYSIDFTVKDHCGSKATGTLKIDVKTKLPSIINLPSAVTVREDVRHEEKLLFEIDVIHSSPIACDLKGVVPTSGRRYFLVRNGNNTLPEVYLKATAHLKYESDDSYELTIKCSAGKETDTGILYVNVQPNKTPTFTNLPSTVNIHADESIIGGAIFYVTADDEEKNPIFYNMSCDPEPCPFDVSQGGSVMVTDDVRKSISNVFYVEVLIEDAFNIAGPEILVVNITGLNRPPLIYNLPEKATVTLTEDAPPMTSIFQVLAADPDVNDTLTYSFLAKPTSMMPLFSINQTSGVIYAINPFNYEGLKTKNIRLAPTVSDGMITSQGTLKVSIIDINEAPDFQYENYTVYTGENKPGYNVAKGLVQATDLDKSDSITYALDCGTETDLFKINPKNADISQMYELDVDKLLVEEREIMCNVSASDRYGMTSHATLRFVVSDENDNAPAFSRTSYLFLATRDLPVFTAIGQAGASDLDTASVNKRLFYYFSEDTDDFVISDNGTIYLVKDLSETAVGTLFKYTINVEDSKRTKDSVPMTVVVLAGSYSALVSSLLVEELTFFSLPENMAWFVTAMHLLVVLVVLILSICGRFFICTIETRRHGHISIAEMKSTADDSRSLEEFVLWNNLNKTGASTRKPSVISVIAANDASPFQKTPRRSSLTPVLESPNNTVAPRLVIEDGGCDACETGKESRVRMCISPDEANKSISSSGNKTAPTSRRGSGTSCTGLPSVQSHLSLSEIDATTMDQSQPAASAPWKPWSISDFAGSFGVNQQVSHPGNGKAASNGRKMSQHLQSNLDF